MMRYACDDVSLERRSFSLVCAPFLQRRAWCIVSGYKVWERFHLYWLSRPVPVHVLRFEDLLERPEACLKDVVAFTYVRTFYFIHIIEQ